MYIYILSVAFKVNIYNGASVLSMEYKNTAIILKPSFNDSISNVYTSDIILWHIIILFPIGIDRLIHPLND